MAPSQAPHFKAAIEQYRTVQSEAQPGKSALKDVQTDNEFEKRLLGEVIPAKDVGVSFEDIGALDEVKRTLREVRWRRFTHMRHALLHRSSCFLSSVLSSLSRAI